MYMQRIHEVYATSTRSICNEYTKYMQRVYKVYATNTQSICNEYTKYNYATRTRSICNAYTKYMLSQELICILRFRLMWCNFTVWFHVRGVWGIIALNNLRSKWFFLYLYLCKVQYMTVMSCSVSISRLCLILCLQ